MISEDGQPDLIKIDVEGAEIAILQSLSQKVPLLCFEWASEWVSQNVECINRLAHLGFTEFAVQHQDEYTYRPPEFPYTTEAVIKFFGGNLTPKLDWGMLWAR